MNRFGNPLFAGGAPPFPFLLKKNIPGNDLLILPVGIIRLFEI